MGDGGRGRGDLILRFRSKYRTVVVETNESDFPVDTLSLSRASPYRRTRGAATTKKNKSSIFVSRKQGKNQQKTGKSSSGSQTKNEPLFFYFKKKYKNVTWCHHNLQVKFEIIIIRFFFLNLISLKIIELLLFLELELISIFLKIVKLLVNYAVAIFRIFQL